MLNIIKKNFFFIIKQKVGELTKKARNLKPYYENSVGGGGVTCSGGDPLSQPEFVSSFFYSMKHVSYYSFYLLAIF